MKLPKDKLVKELTEKQFYYFTDEYYCSDPNESNLTLCMANYHSYTVKEAIKAIEEDNEAVYNFLHSE